MTETVAMGTGKMEKSPESHHSPANSPAARTHSRSSSTNSATGPLNCVLPSPPITRPGEGSATPNQQLPPSCGAKQLSKLKRFLTTLQQFGSEISLVIGERVRSLVLALVNSRMSIEEFHSKLQETTNFPLKPFVIPFLKATLPLLQKELLQCAQMARLSTQQFLAQNEHVLFDQTISASSHSPINAMDAHIDQLNENGKRTSPDSTKSNGPPLKRIMPRVTTPLSAARSPPRSLIPTPGPIRLEDISQMSRSRLESVELGRFERPLLSMPLERPDSIFETADRTAEDDWKHIDSMLNCIVGMVDKTKRALAVLQDRSARDREELALWMKRHAEGVDNDMKKRTSEMMTHTIKQTEDRVAEVRRSAEDAVNEVKRQAVVELQKAVAAAESKANELLNQEKSKMDKSLQQIKSTARDEALETVNVQEDSRENCWNCGRKASETCSGCNIARYCGSFCQHKDWDVHHKQCGKTKNEGSTKSTTKAISPRIKSTEKTDSKITKPATTP